MGEMADYHDPDHSLRSPHDEEVEPPDESLWKDLPTSRDEEHVHVPSRAMGFLMLDTAIYCAVCGKKLEDGDPVTHQP
jgi:hypothetical protein